MILLYQLENTVSWPSLQAALSIHRLSYRHVVPAEYHIPLGQLAHEPVGSFPASAASQPIAEPMLIFCGLAPETLNQFLDLMRRLNISGIALKAVLTPTNQNWNSLQIYEELKKERAAFERR